MAIMEMLPYLKKVAFVPHVEPVPFSFKPPRPMTRKNNADLDVKRHQKSWISGTQARFLQSHNAAWLSAAAQGPDATGALYPQITKRWIEQYGQHFDRQKDLKDDAPDPNLESLREAEESVSDAKVAKCEAYRKDIRAVSLFRMVTQDEDSRITRKYVAIAAEPTRLYQASRRLGAVELVEK
ncbi:hypothetical protein FIBSPDRAFT_956590 [Athelia psychrophila]|uniref:Uncharacterized protein n=1 Tax=Athelia psychrophila TaxID=1759441 RepID=A0A166GNU6_9AGAM|nr:hypothetical protein FIBSPDRAFT_956590 [Fibularhizoctonia sp. CBS 109695]